MVAADSPDAYAHKMLVNELLGVDDRGQVFWLNSPGTYAWSPGHGAAHRVIASKPVR